jgi:tetratricopeptide (TPR) repeat protein
LTPDTDSSEDELLSAAYEESRNYEWTAAIALYQRALEQMSKNRDSSDRGRVVELLATSYYNAAFQSVSRQEFCQRMKHAEDFYHKVAELYGESRSIALAKKSETRSSLATFWLEQEPENRRKLVEKCISLLNEAAQLFERIDDRTNLAETHGHVLECSRQALHLATDWKTRYEEFERILEVGRKTVNEFEELGDHHGLVEALHATLWALAVESEVILDQSKFKQLSGETAQLGMKLQDAAQRIGTPRALCLANEAAADIAWDLEGDLTKALILYEKAATCAEQANDMLARGRLLAVMSGLQHWRGGILDYVEERRGVLLEGLRFAEEAIEKLSVPLHTSYLVRAYYICSSCHCELADLVQTEPGRRREHLLKAVELARKGTEYEYGTTEWIGAAHAMSKAMYFLATMERNAAERRRLLTEVLPVREDIVRVTDILEPHSWNRGVWRNYLALTKAELSRIEEDPEAKRRLLQEAVSSMEECIDYCEKWASAVPGSAPRLARYHEWYGDILQQNYLCMLEARLAERAGRAYLDAIEHWNKAVQLVPIPALRWKIAKLYDSLGDTTRASEAFQKAAEDYTTAADKIPGGSTAFRELAVYMEAWASIENARLSHAEGRHDLSHENYVRVVDLLRTAKPWRGLAMLCDARSMLEKGEALGYEEKHGAAIESLTTALNRFRHARKEFEEMVRTATDELARREIEDWSMIAERREAYTSGLIELEEARSLERSGGKVTSSGKYKAASVTFRTLATKIPEAQDRAEMENLAQFCESWARRKEAESKSSPELFAEAAESFMKAKETATNPSLRLLAMGDASICRALESGTRFRQSRDVQLYSEIKRHLEVASDHYTEAGFKKTGTWTRATQRLFDALMLLAGAEVEREVGKKTELYHVAEKHLVLAAKLYGEAGFPSKKRETLEQLERTREEKEVLLAPLEALAEIPTASATHLPPITLRGAQPLGLERFEDAKVTGELRTPQTHLTTGSDFTVNIDIANVGKTPATLIKLEGVVPEGCEPVEKQSTQTLEGNSLDLKGKRLEYLKTHGVQVSFRPTRKGEFELSPRVVYVDEKGNYKSTNLQPLYLTVREPSISEGLHAPPSVHLPQDFQFENERSRQVFPRLVKEFLDDYMTKRIVMERAGWRSLMDVIRDVKIPRSAMYGPGGRTGPVLAELERRGLVETRVFPKERGRGGEIRKVRVAYENTIVRRIVDRAVMENA